MNESLLSSLALREGVWPFKPTQMSFPRKRESRATATSPALDPRFRGGDSPGEMRRQRARTSTPPISVPQRQLTSSLFVPIVTSSGFEGQALFDIVHQVMRTGARCCGKAKPNGRLRPVEIGETPRAMGMGSIARTTAVSLQLGPSDPRCHAGERRHP